MLHFPGRHRLQKLFSAFPDGWPGLGLIILRLAVALSGTVQGYFVLSTLSGVELGARIIGLISIIAGFLLLIGFLTPVAGTIATLGNFIHSVDLFFATDPSSHAGAFAALDLAIMSLTLVLLGPGSFSLDARLFGRREIIIPDSRRPRR